jgi:ankyrin repeat protein
MNMPRVKQSSMVERAHALWNAAFHDRRDEVEDLLNAGADFEYLCSWATPLEGEGYSSDALMAAACKGNITIMTLLLHFGADPTAVNPVGYTALHFATQHNRVDAVKLLLANHADVTQTDRIGMNATHIAVILGHCDVLVELLLEDEADINVGHYRSALPLLHMAVNKGQMQCLEILLQYDADHSIENRHGRSALHYAVRRTYNTNVVTAVTIMLEHGFDVDEVDMLTGQRPLHWAVGTGNTNLTNLLVAASADIEAPDWDGYRPLHHAAVKGWANTVQILMDQGADILSTLAPPLNLLDPLTLNPKP